MAVEVRMPKLGVSMQEGEIVDWLKAEGEDVEKGEPIVIIMTQKTTYEVESPADGIVHIIVPEEEVLPVGKVMGYILAAGEDPPAGDTTDEEEGGETEAPAPTEDRVKEEEEFVQASPRARRLARQLHVELSKVEGTGPGGAILPDDVQRYHDESEQETAAPERVQASPLARRLAEREGIDLTAVEGSGPNGRIMKDDVIRAQESMQEVTDQPAERIPFGGARATIAEQMMKSVRSKAQFTLMVTVDVTALKATKEALQRRNQQKVSYTAFVVKAVAQALREHGLLAGRLEDNEIVLPDAINIGIAVATENGLIVPVVEQADDLSVSEITAEIQNLAQRARNDELTVDDVTGSVFTITNLGMFGVEAFTPIINPPEAAILGVGRIADEVAWSNGKAMPRSRMTLSLTIDHRIVDGAPAAMFLQTLTQLLEHPVLLFSDEE